MQLQPVSDEWCLSQGGAVQNVRRLRGERLLARLKLTERMGQIDCVPSFAERFARMLNGLPPSLRERRMRLYLRNVADRHIDFARGVARHADETAWYRFRHLPYGDFVDRLAAYGCS